MSAAAGSSSEDTLALIKPNAYGKKSEIQQIIRDQKFEIVESFDLELERSDAEAFYAEHKDRPFFGELVDFMTSGTITAMRLRRSGAIASWRLCMGPTNFEVAKKEVPTSIRALYGESMTANASHGSDSEESAARELDFFFGEAGVVQRSMTDTLGLIKPNAYDKRTEIEEIIEKNGFEIVDSYDLQLQRSDAESFYAEHKERPFFGELVDFMTSGRIVALRLRRCNGISAWRTLMGPTNFEVAKAEAPQSIRALYGESMTANASHGSDSAESAARELDFFFGPSGVVTNQLEDTLALVKPNAFAKREEIKKIILRYGFEIVEAYDLTLARNDAEAFYAEHKERPFFGELVDFMVSGQITAMRLRKCGAIKEWRSLMGPTNHETAKAEAPGSIRALYGESMTANASHGSDSTESAAREVGFFFGEGGVIERNFEDTLALIKPNAFGKRTEIQALIRENGFVVVESYELQLTEEQAKEFYAEHSERGFFGELVEFMTSGQIVAMRLRKEDAITAWRKLMGPTNFEVAKTEAPGSIRALYGESMTANASHGSDAPESAARELDFFFGPGGVAVSEGGWIDISGDGGIMKKVLKQGKGGFPGEGANVFCHYVGTLTANGVQFDSSRGRGSPFNFPIGQGRVIRGWDEGIATMRKGEMCILRCRSDYAYGDQATGNIPAGASLDFEVELLSFDLYADLETGLKWRKIVRASEDEYEQPSDYDTAIISYFGTLYDEEKDLGLEEAAKFEVASDAVVFAKGEQFEYIVGDMDDSLYPPGFDKAVQNMMVGEDCVFVVTSPLGFGVDGNADLGVPAGNTPLQYRIKLHQIRNAQSKYDLSGLEILELCETLKKEGNDYFSAGNYPKAMKRYSRIVDSFLDDFDEDDKFEDETEAKEEDAAAAGTASRQKASELVIKVRNNLALIKYKLKEYSECLEECDKILEIDAKNVKAVVRRAQALIQLGNNAEAKRELKLALKLDPSNEAIPRLQKINAKKIKQQKQKEIDLAKRMFSRPLSGGKKKKSRPDSASASVSTDASSDSKEEVEPVADVNAQA